MTILLLAAFMAAPPSVFFETALPDFQAAVVASELAIPVETQMSGIDGVAHVRTLSTDGRCLFRLDLKPKADAAAIRAEAAKRISLAAPALPVKYQEAGVAMQPAVAETAIALVLDTQRLNAVEATSLLEAFRQRINTLPFVAKSTLLGGRHLATRVYFDPDRLARYALPVADIAAEIRKHATAIQGAPTNANGLEDLVVGSRAGQQVHLRDLARVELGAFGSDVEGCWIRRPGEAARPAAAIVVSASPGKAADVSRSLSELLPQLQKELPEGTMLRQWSIFARMPAVRTRGVLGGTFDTSRASRLAQRLLETADAPSGRQPEAALVLSAGEGLDLTVIPLGLQPEAVRRLVRNLRKIEPDVGVMPLPHQPTLRTSWPGEGFEVAVRFRSADWVELQSAAEDFARRFAAVKGVADCTVESTSKPTVQFRIDEVKAKAMEIAVSDIEQAIQLATSGVRIPVKASDGKPGEILLKTYSASLDETLREVSLLTKRGERVPLAAVAAIQKQLVPAFVEREDGRNCIVVGCNVEDREVEAVRYQASKLAKEMKKSGVEIEGRGSADR